MSATADVTFTILINNYNYGRFLAKAIQSALDQTWPQVQVLVVDDGSSDDSLEIAARFAGSNYMVLAKPNGGQNSAIACGLVRARGDYTIILDSDDWLKPEACETIAMALEGQRPNGIHYRLDKMDLEGRLTGRYPVLPFVSHNQRAHLLRHGTIPTAPTSGNAYRTDFLRTAFGHILPGTWFSDGYLAMAAAWTQQTICLDQTLGTYTVHGGNVSNAAGRDQARRFRNNNFAIDHYRHFYAWLKARGEDPPRIEEMFDAYVWQAILYFKLKAKAYPEYSLADCRRFGMKRFCVASQHGLAKQAKNILFIWMGSLAGEVRELLQGRA